MGRFIPLFRQFTSVPHQVLSEARGDKGDFLNSGQEKSLENCSDFPEVR